MERTECVGEALTGAGFGHNSGVIEPEPSKLGVCYGVGLCVARGEFVNSLIVYVLNSRRIWWSYEE